MYLSLPQQVKLKKLNLEKLYKTPRRKSIMGKEEKKEL